MPGYLSRPLCLFSYPFLPFGLFGLLLEGRASWEKGENWNPFLVLINFSENMIFSFFMRGSWNHQMTWGFGFSGAFSCGLFPDRMDGQELSVSVMVVFGRDGNLVGKKKQLPWNQIWVLIPALPCISSVTLDRLLKLCKPKFNSNSQHLSAHDVPNIVINAFAYILYFSQ